MTEELKPGRCGCGGNAVAIGDADNNIYFVKCDKCWISTDLFHSEAEAITAWNKAMGATDKNVGDKFDKDTNVPCKEMVIIEPLVITYGGYCKCGNLVNTDWQYCPSCGVRLEWE